MSKIPYDCPNCDFSSGNAKTFLEHTCPAKPAGAEPSPTPASGPTRCEMCSMLHEQWKQEKPDGDWTQGVYEYFLSTGHFPVCPSAPCNEKCASQPAEGEKCRPLTEWDFSIPANNKFEDWPLDKLKAQQPAPTQPSAREWLDAQDDRFDCIKRAEQVCNVAQLLEAYAAQASAGLRAERDHFKAAYARKIDEVAVMGEQFQQTLKEVDSVKAERDEITRQRDNTQAQLKATQADRDKWIEDLRKAESELSALRTQLDAFKAFVTHRQGCYRFKGGECDCGYDHLMALRSKQQQTDRG